MDCSISLRIITLDCCISPEHCCTHSNSVSESTSWTLLYWWQRGSRSNSLNGPSVTMLICEDMQRIAMLHWGCGENRPNLWHIWIMHTYIWAINNDPAILGQGLLTSHHGQKSLSWFAEQGLDAVVSHETQTLLPCWKTNHLFVVFKMDIKEAERISGAHVNGLANCTALINFITKVALLAKICNVPWSSNPIHVARRSITTVTLCTQPESILNNQMWFHGFCMTILNALLWKMPPNVPWHMILRLSGPC